MSMQDDEQQAEAKSGDYKVGYRKPPIKSRFKPGQSGNPGGRRRTARKPGHSALQTLFDREITLNAGTGMEVRSLEEALQLKTYQEALKGKAMAIREVLGWILKREIWLAKNRPQLKQSVIFAGTRQDPDNADDMLIELGIAKHNPAREGLNQKRAQLLLEPWVVKLAFRKRGLAQSLRCSQVENVRRCTRDDGSIVWPEGTGT